MVKKYVNKYLVKEVIRPSILIAALPVILVKKPGRGLRLYIDYRAINTIIIKNQYLILYIRETLIQLSKATYFTKLDIVAAFNRIRITKGYKYKIAF